MKKSKRIFLILSAIFLIAMVLIGLDISRRTTFPGAKKDAKVAAPTVDSLRSDTSGILNK